MSKQELLRPGALYIRVSTHGRQEELSPAAQKRLLLKYAKGPWHCYFKGLYL